MYFAADTDLAQILNPCTTLAINKYESLPLWQRLAALCIMEHILQDAGLDDEQTQLF